MSQASIFDHIIEGTLSTHSIDPSQDGYLLQQIILGKYIEADSYPADSTSILDRLAIAIQFSKQGKFEESDYYWIPTIEEASLIFNQRDRLFINLEYGGHLVRKNKLNQADSLFNLLISIPNQSPPQSGFLMAYLYEQFALLKYLRQEYQAAQSLFLKSDSTWNATNEASHPWLISYWNHYALLLSDLGDYEQAEEGFNEALALASIKPYQTQHYIGDISSNLGHLYQQLGDFNQALEYYNQAKKIYNTLKLYIEEATINNNMALLYDEADSLEVAKTYYRESLHVYENHLGKGSLAYALILSNLAGLLDYEESYLEAEGIYLESLDVIQDLLGKENTYYTTLQNNLALVYENIGNPDKAIELYQEALEINSRVLGNRHPKYLELLYNLAGILSYTNPKKSLDIYNEANEKQLDLLKYYYAAFDEETRINYLEEINIEFEKYYATAIQNLNPKVAREVFEFSIKTNGLAAEFSRDLKEKIANEPNEIKVLFKRWQQLRDSLAYALVLSEQKRVASNIEITELMRAVDQSESRWIRSLDDLPNPIVSFQGIQEKLDEDELAINFIRFEGYKGGLWQDTVWYYAIITDPAINYPKIVRLSNEPKLKVELGKGLFPLQYEGQRNNLSEIILNPISSSLDGKKKVYISPVGILHRIPFNALNSGGDFLIKEFAIEVLTNLKDLKQPKSIPTGQNALFVGGLEYNGRLTNSMDIIPSFQRIGGTAQEVKLSQEILEKKGWETEVIQNHSATKSNVLSKLRANNIQICHFATHGYAFDYIPSAEYSDLSVRNRIITSRNPLLRSGLILSEANLYWNHNPKNSESGILSTYDIANLRLNNIQLVILSSCESGIGDIHSEEGVFGLPRAFKIAGAQKIIYTLWQIDDQKSSQFIKYFYKYYSKFSDTNRAFRKAQLRMSRKFDPFYWAGFVLVN